MPSKKQIRVFGRITASQADCIDILTFFNNSSYLLACYEQPDSGCTSSHCHFIAESEEYTSMNSLRNQFSKKVLKKLELPGRYSLKEEDTQQDAVAYICKDKDGHSKYCKNGHEHSTTVPTNIFINRISYWRSIGGIEGLDHCKYDIVEAHKRYWDVFSELKASKSIKNTWKSVIEYIESVDQDFFQRPLRHTTGIRIASHLYDWYVTHEKIIHGKFHQQMIIQTIITQKYNSKTLKKSMIMEWCSDLQYWNGMENTFDSEAKDEFDDL